MDINFQKGEPEFLLFYLCVFLTNGRFHSRKKENYFSSLLQTKPSMSVIVQKIQFRICLRWTFSHLFRKKCGFHFVICDVWQWLKQQFIWLMHLQMHATTDCRKSLNIKGHKCIQKLLGRSFVFKLSNSSPAHSRILQSWC